MNNYMNQVKIFTRKMTNYAVSLESCQLRRNNTPEHMTLEGKCVNNLDWRVDVWSVTHGEEFTTFFSTSGGVFKAPNDKITFRFSEKELNDPVYQELLDIKNTLSPIIRKWGNKVDICESLKSDEYRVIAIDECILLDTGEPTLIVGKVYRAHHILDFREQDVKKADQIVLMNENGDLHYFDNPKIGCDFLKEYSH